LFDRPATARRAKAWRPSPTLLPVSNARGFAPVRWGEDGEVSDFAEAGFPARPQDFQLQRYQPLSQPLSELSKQALARFDAELAAENPVIVDVEDDTPELPYQADPMLVHPPFVPDVWEVDEPDASEAAANNEHAASTDLSEAPHEDNEAAAASIDAMDAEDEGAVARAADETMANEATTDDSTFDAFASDAVTEAVGELAEAPDAAAVAAADAIAAVEASDTLEATPAADDLDAPLSETEHTDALEADTAGVTEPEPEDETAATAAGDLDLGHSAVETPPVDAQTTDTEAIDADATEAALTDEDAIAPDTLEVAEQERQDAVAQVAVTAPGIDPEDVARREAEHYQRGYEEGERVAREAMAQEIAAQRTVLEGVTQELHALLQDPQQFFEPLKRLALHVAEQVVMTELQTSTRAIEHLIQRCLDTLDHPAQGAVVVELHPQDKARLQEAAPQLLQGMRLDTAEDLRPGSVRVFANDTIVEDLVQHRLHALARSLKVDADAWQAHSSLLNDAVAEPAATDPTEPDDVHS